jgi:D-ribose pyranase
VVISDRGFPFWPEIETIDISLIDGIPSVLQVIDALKPNFVIGQAYMAQEFATSNDPATVAKFQQSLAGIPLTFEPHIDFKKRVPSAIGLIRTGDTVPYANTILVSA